MPPQDNLNVKLQTASSNSGMAILAYLGVLIVVPFLTGAKNDPFVKFHLKQGLALLITEFVWLFVNVVPFIGWLIGFVIGIFVVVMTIMGIVNAVSGKEKALPIIGGIAKTFNF